VKLNLIFIVMDLLTMLAYPFFFAYNKIHQVSKPREPRIQPTL